MKKHDWRNNYFSFGRWGGYETCLMEWKCFHCDEIITLPDGCDKPDNNSECKGGGQNGARIQLQELQCLRDRNNKPSKNNKKKRNRVPQKSKFKKQSSR